MINSFPVGGWAKLGDSEPVPGKFDVNWDFREDQNVTKNDAHDRILQLF